MNYITIEQRGNSFFTNFFLVMGKSMVHKQIEWRDDLRFVRLKKRCLIA
ncbi:MAG: hypothetical protein KKG59_07890 [Nanoarchaeota archaeon]|nr:hypothetical protein [Nanoarchaeota archaeon]